MDGFDSQDYSRHGVGLSILLYSRATQTDRSAESIVGCRKPRASHPSLRPITSMTSLLVLEGPVAVDEAPVSAVRRLAGLSVLAVTLHHRSMTKTETDLKLRMITRLIEVRKSMFRITSRAS